MEAIRVELGDPAWRPMVGADGDCAQASVKLLRALLRPEPGQRPAHAIQISRMLATVRATLMGPQSLQSERELVRALGRPSARNGWLAGGLR